MFDLTPVTDLVADLQAVGIRASLDPATVNPPGVWVQVVDMAGHTLATNRYDLQLVAITDDADATRAMNALVDLVNQLQVNAALPIPSATAATATLPSGVVLPALQIPATVYGPR